MDSVTRVTNAIQRKPLDRVPRYDSFWEDTLTEWRQQGMPPDMDPQDFFDWDIRMMAIDVSMRCEQKALHQDDTYLTYADRYGYTIRKTIGKSRALEFSDHVTRDKQTWQSLKHRFEFDPNDTARIDTASYFMHMEPYPTWAGARQLYDGLRKTGKYLCFNAYGPWEGTWRHRGYSQLLMDLALGPPWVREMADTQNDLLIACLKHCIRLGMKPDGLFLVDDLACTRGTLFSPDCWRQVFRPAYEQLGEFLRANGISFWLHCCGNCEALLADFIDCGLEVIQPLQAHAGLDIRELKAAYGASLTFWGNIDVRKMSGPAEACEQEIREKVVCGKEGGGYMYHSDHSVPPEVTFSRYQWIMELLDKYGRY